MSVHDDEKVSFDIELVPCPTDTVFLFLYTWHGLANVIWWFRSYFSTRGCIYVGTMMIYIYVYDIISLMIDI